MYSEMVSEDYIGRVKTDVINMTKNAFQAIGFVYNKFQCFPCSIQVNSVMKMLPYKRVMKLLASEPNYKSENDIIIKTVHATTKFKHVRNQLSEVDTGVIFCVKRCFFLNKLTSDSPIEYDFEDYCQLIGLCVIYYIPEKEAYVEELVKRLTAVKIRRMNNSTLNMICKIKNNFVLKPIKIKEPIIRDFQTSYGDEFAKINSLIKDKLSTPNANGIILLNGLPGTGKTNYIRYYYF